MKAEQKPELEAQKTPDHEHICPRCRKAPLRTRTPRHSLVKTLLFFLPLKRYKCYRCKKKSYILDWK